MHARPPYPSLPSSLPTFHLPPPLLCPRTGAVSDLLEKMGMKPTDVDILVTCTSIFCPTPSLASMLVNRFKMRTNVQSYHLGGMGW
jgi:hypothetical protein